MWQTLSGRKHPCTLLVRARRAAWCTGQFRLSEEIDQKIIIGGCCECEPMDKWTERSNRQISTRAIDCSWTHRTSNVETSGPRRSRQRKATYLRKYPHNHRYYCSFVVIVIDLRTVRLKRRDQYRRCLAYLDLISHAQVLRH